MRIRPGTEWDSETFEDEDLRAADLRGCRFENCDFVRCTLTDADLSGCVFEECRGRSCELSKFKIVGTKFRGVRFEASRVRGVLWNDVYELGLELAFVDSNLSYSTFSGLHLADFVATGCALHEVDFGECVIKSADFSGSDLAGALFHHAKLENVDFSSARNVLLDVRTAKKMKRVKLPLDGAIATLGVLGIEVVLD